MTGLFLAPATDRKGAYRHFCKTVLNGIPRKLYSDEKDEILNSDVRVWGLTSSTKPTWTNVEDNDWVLFYTQENKYQYAAQVLRKEHNPELGDTIREELLEGVSDKRDWDYLLLFDEPVSVSVSGEEVAELLEYKNRFPVRFMRVTDERLQNIQLEYTNLNKFIDDIKE